MPVEDARAILAHDLRRIESVGKRVGHVHAEAHVRIEVLDQLVGRRNGREEPRVAGLRIGAVIVDGEPDAVFVAEL